MASVERIKQDIAALHQSTQSLAGELHQAYGDYLRALGQALRQQIVLSGYQVCTQGYPRQFLGLSLSQRQALQRSLRELAQHTQAALLELLSPPGSSSAELPVGGDADASTPTAVEPVAETPALPKPLNPVGLSHWQERLEAAIAHEFRVVTLKANRVLQQAGILPNQLPAFLQATSQLAADSEDPDAPQMLDFLMEAQSQAEDEDDDENGTTLSMIVQLVAVQLQLTDVEFADGTTTVLRNRLRSLAARLKTLKQTYLKKERELTIAAAQDAWRSAWIED